MKKDAESKESGQSQGKLWAFRPNGSPDLKSTQDAWAFAHQHYGGEKTLRLLELWRQKYQFEFYYLKTKKYKDLDAMSRIAFELQLVKETLQEWELIKRELEKLNDK